MQESEKRSTDVMVGAFVVLGAAAIIAGTMWAREGHLGRGTAAVVARFREVGGAGVGTNAYIRGVRAGRVAAVELGDDGWVRVRIALEPAVRLPADPVVLLGGSSLVGDWQATIVPHDSAPGDTHVRRQLAEAAGERGVVPGATMPDVKQLAAGAGRVLEDIGFVTGSARVAFDDIAAREFRVAIANAAAVSAHLAVTSDAIRRTALRADSASSSGEIQRVIRDVGAAAVDLRAVAGELRLLTARDSDTRVAVDRVLARMDTLVGRTTAGQGTIGQAMRDPSLYANADSLLLELRALVADFKANPRRYVSIRIF
jgi:phospholipid/cholesterol/gamma-HCH transport system substrate-binding protein